LLRIRDDLPSSLLIGQTYNHEHTIARMAQACGIAAITVTSRQRAPLLVEAHRVAMAVQAVWLIRPPYERTNAAATSGRSVLHEAWTRCPGHLIDRVPWCCTDSSSGAG